jgi:hypothetical protein
VNKKRSTGAPWHPEDQPPATRALDNHARTTYPLDLRIPGRTRGAPSAAPLQRGFVLCRHGVQPVYGSPAPRTGDDRGWEPGQQNASTELSRQQNRRGTGKEQARHARETGMTKMICFSFPRALLSPALVLSPACRQQPLDAAAARAASSRASAATGRRTGKEQAPQAQGTGMRNQRGSCCDPTPVRQSAQESPLTPPKLPTDQQPEHLNT